MDGKMQDEKENKSNILETENPDEMFPPRHISCFPYTLCDRTLHFSHANVKEATRDTLSRTNTHVCPLMSTGENAISRSIVPNRESVWELY